MRSRDGNKYRSFAVSLILFSSLVLNASEYLISYRYVVKDLALYNESLTVSRAMKSCQGTPQNYIELLTNDEDDLNVIIKNNADEFIDFIHKIGLSVEHKEKTSSAQNTSTTVMVLRTTCFKVDFNQNFAKISALN